MPDNPRIQRSSRKIDPTKVKELADIGISTSDIAKHQGVNPSTVTRFLQKIKPERQALAQFKEQRADVFALLHSKNVGIQDRILDSMDDDAFINALKGEQKSRVLRDLTVAAGIGYDKERLERGQSTQNAAFWTKIIVESDKSLFRQDKCTEVGHPAPDSTSGAGSQK